MANSSQPDKILRNMSVIQEEDDGVEVTVKSNGDTNTTFNEHEKMRLSFRDCDPNKKSPGDRDIHVSQPTTANSDISLKDESSKNFTFNNSSSVLGSFSEEAPSSISNVDSPISDILNPGIQKIQDVPKNSTNLIPADMISYNGVTDNNVSNNTVSALNLLNHQPPSPKTDNQLPATEAASQEKEPSSRRQFQVSNVDEATLKNETQNEIRETDIINTEPSPEHKPLLEKSSSTYSDSDHSTYNLDTIGPLENPRFLQMLNYSVSRAVQDDGFKSCSNMDLANFKGTQTLTDMDSGWAWVVLFAAFSSLMLTGATSFAAGVLMPAILHNIDSDIAKVSWVGAVHISVLCMSGPFVGTILNFLGSRRTVFCAGLFLSGGIFAASFASSIVELIITHGLVAGIGSGFILNTMYVTVGQYFNTYRGLACGLLATGSGVGMLAGGNALTALVNYYGLKGTYLFWAGVMLHILIFAMLLRPSPTEQLRRAEKERINAEKAKRKRGRKVRGDGSVRSGTNSFSSARPSSLMRSQKSINKSSQSEGVASLLKSVLHRDLSRSISSVNTNRSVRGIGRSNSNIPTNQSASIKRPNSLNVSSTTPVPPATQSPSASNVSVQDKANRMSSGDKKLTEEKTPLMETGAVAGSNQTDNSPQKASSTPLYTRAPSEVNRSSFRKRLTSGTSQAPSTYTSSGRLGYRTSIREQLQHNDLDNESLASTLVSYLQPQDALNPRFRLGSRSVSSLFGSVASLPTALIVIKDDLSQIETAEPLKKKKTIGDHCSSFLDSLRLLRNKPFLVFIITCMLWSFADSPFTIYLPSYAISKGATQVEASSLYTAMGFGSMCGRFLSGMAASNNDVGPILIHIGCLSIVSLIVIISPWITSTYLEQMICSGLFGLYSGSLSPLSSLITIHLLGIEDLGLGFGFLSMAQGISYLAGPPVMGAIIEAINYENGFRVAGFILLCGSVMDMLITLLIRKDEDESIGDSFDDLEQALGRISDNESDEDVDMLSDQKNKQKDSSSPTGNTSPSNLQQISK